MKDKIFSVVCIVIGIGLVTFGLITLAPYSPANIPICFIGGGFIGGGIGGLI